MNDLHQAPPNISQGTGSAGQYAKPTLYFLSSIFYSLFTYTS
ncbi:hypothetical protein VCRA2113O415_30127 [Vibrio crassostreae]|nr:hypothetical protein VCRA2110O182_70017 [Vibrio crassostreae]CAK2364026.1 hypothetical protein VCRA2111O408_70200 [Vibrio crassostreae]CAK2377695.1 hypothetical protein VCRA211O406_70202 [Vibrio crassostreae]CAK2493783.1 hypothetical protein VCRA2113O415_30127 [Vibrio crassostreae]CAK2898040.1 hypothetical protein VCRA2113O420_40130 [Vibrio crassostreae]